MDYNHYLGFRKNYYPWPQDEPADEITELKERVKQLTVENKTLKQEVSELRNELIELRIRETFNV